MSLKLNMNASGNSRKYFRFKPCGYTHLRELELHGMNIRNTVVPPYPLIQYPRFQLSAVYRGPKKKWKIKEKSGS
jgi:hypothetical protein